MTRNLLLTALLLVCLTAPAFAAEKTSAYDRIMKTQTLRCGYGTVKPYIWQDTDGKLTGFYVELAEELARQVNLKLEWPEETGWAEIPTALYNGRVDLACSIMWNDPVRGRQMAFTRPLFYTPVYAWHAEGDARFSGNLEDINDPAVRIAVQDGDFTIALAKRMFPKAQLVSVPAAAQWTDLFMNVVTGKADIMLTETTTVVNFNANNKKKLVRMKGDTPLLVYGNAFGVSIREPELFAMVDNAVRYMQQTGRTADLTADFRKEYPGAILLPKTPY